MTHLIDKSVVLAEIKRRLELVEKRLKRNNSYTEEGNIAWERDKALYDAYNSLLNSLDTLETKEVDLNEEIEKCLKQHNMLALSKKDFTNIAKHFFELGIRFNNPITATDRFTAEEIIINLKRIESDYRIDLTKEIEWLRNQVKK